MDFSDCMTHCVMPAECTARRDDYFECLHHRKEVFSLYPSALPNPVLPRSSSLPLVFPCPLEPFRLVHPCFLAGCNNQIPVLGPLEDVFELFSGLGLWELGLEGSLVIASVLCGFELSILVFRPDTQDL
jgi:hypothetical protein